MIKVFHIITGLNTGGAEMMLVRLLEKTNRDRFKPVVVSLIDEGTLGQRIKALDIPVHILKMKPSLPNPATIWTLRKLIKSHQPRLVQGWMYHGNLMALWSVKNRKLPVIWNIRQSLYNLKYEKWMTARIIQLGATLSRHTARIIYNAHIAADQHEAIGYQASKRVILSNGFDVEAFSPSIEARSAVRTELCLPDSVLLIGLIGRYHPMKDHENFLKAASLLRQSHPDVHFLLAGRGVDEQNDKLTSLINMFNLSKCTHLLGERNDMPRLQAALDIATSSSYTEGFPNVVAEAMSCATPCVVTDVGDAARIVGDTGKVVPPKNPEALVEGWRSLIGMGTEQRQALGQQARQRIVKHYSIEKIRDQYETLYQNVVAGGA